MTMVTEELGNCSELVVWVTGGSGDGRWDNSTLSGVYVWKQGAKVVSWC